MISLFRFALLILAVSLLISGIASAATPGSCSSFAAGSCPASIPNGVTSFYFIDYASGSDANPGTSESAPWQHLPTCANATGSASAHTPGAGEGWILKGGVTVDYRCWPANLPWGGANGAPDYIGPDPGWYTGTSWSRPIFSGGGTSFNADTVGFLLNDNKHHASYLVLDNIEFTGFYWDSATNCYVQSSACGYVGYYNHGLSSGSDVSWEFKNFYAHNITHGSYSASGTNDQAPYGLFWMPRDAASSAHDFVIDNTDGGQDCCGSVTTGNMYNFYLTGLNNGIYNPTTSSSGESILLVHDFDIVNPVATFMKGSGVNGTTPPHGNCIHVFGTQPSSYNELFYNGRIDCTETEAETLETEEDYATTWVFNLVVTNEYQPNGFDTSFFSSSGLGGTYHFFDITEECGGPQGGTFGPYPCFAMRGSNKTDAYNMFGIAVSGGNGPTSSLVCELSGCGDLGANYTGTFTSAPNSTYTCGSSTTTNFGGTIICAPIGTGNGTGNLNLTQTYPFAPLDSTAAATVGTASSATVKGYCTTISGINAAAGTACLSDTTLGVAYNTSNHTVSYPARAPIAHPASGNWEIGAYEPPTSGTPPQPPTGLTAVVQ